MSETAFLFLLHQPIDDGEQCRLCPQSDTQSGGGADVHYVRPSGSIFLWPQPIIRSHGGPRRLDRPTESFCCPGYVKRVGVSRAIRVWGCVFDLDHPPEPSITLYDFPEPAEGVLMDKARAAVPEIAVPTIDPLTPSSAQTTGRPGKSSSARCLAKERSISSMSIRGLTPSICTRRSIMAWASELISDNALSRCLPARACRHSFLID